MSWSTTLRSNNNVFIQITAVNEWCGVLLLSWQCGALDAGATTSDINRISPTLKPQVSALPLHLSFLPLDLSNFFFDLSIFFFEYFIL